MVYYTIPAQQLSLVGFESGFLFNDTGLVRLYLFNCADPSALGAWRRALLPAPAAVKIALTLLLLLTCMRTPQPRSRIDYFVRGYCAYEITLLKHCRMHMF